MRNNSHRDAPCACAFPPSARLPKFETSESGLFFGRPEKFKHWRLAIPGRDFSGGTIRQHNSVVCENRERKVTRFNRCTAHFLDGHGAVEFAVDLVAFENQHAGGEILFDTMGRALSRHFWQMGGEQIGCIQLSLDQLHKGAGLVLTWAGCVVRQDEGGYRINNKKRGAESSRIVAKIGDDFLRIDTFFRSTCAPGAKIGRGVQNDQALFLDMRLEIPGK